MEKESARDRVKRCIEDLESSDPEVRQKAVYGLRYTRSKAGREAILGALDDPDPKVQRAATWVLTDQPGLLDAVPKLISLLAATDVATRIGAIHALSDMRDQRAVEPLAELVSDPESLVRLAAANALGSFGDRRALQALLDALVKADTEDRESIWHNLGAAGFADEVEHLAYLLDEPNWTVRPEDKVAALEPPEKPVRRLPADQVEKIRGDIAQFASADQHAAWKAVSRLGRRRGQVVEFLAEATASPKSVVRHLALHALEKVGDARAFRVVLEMTRDPLPDTRWCALQILGQLWGERALPVLIDVLLNSEVYAELAGAGEGLEAVGKPAVPWLIEVLNTSSGDLRMRAAAILRGLGDERAIPHLAKLLDDPDPEMRIAGQEEIAIMGEDQVSKLGPRCLKLVERMLDDPDERVRENARYWFDELSEMISNACAEVSAPSIS